MEARSCLDGAPRRSKLEALTRAVVGEEKLIAVAELKTLEPIREKIEAGERLDFDDGVAILESDDLLELGALADVARRVRGGSDEVYFVQNRRCAGRP